MQEHPSFEGVTTCNTGAQLVYAAENGDLELVNRLLRHRADANFTDEVCSPVTCDIVVCFPIQLRSYTVDMSFIHGLLMHACTHART